MARHVVLWRGDKVPENLPGRGRPTPTAHDGPRRREITGNHCCKGPEKGGKVLLLRRLHRGRRRAGSRTSSLVEVWHPEAAPESPSRTPPTVKPSPRCSLGRHCVRSGERNRDCVRGHPVEGPGTDVCFGRRERERGNCKSRLRVTDPTPDPDVTSRPKPSTRPAPVC